MSPFFSIVIPTYNRSDLITRTIESLLDQSFTAFEIIVIDDGSTDGTESVIANIVDPRLSYHKKANGERGAARNFGSAQARGRYINFFDSDDIAYPNHLQIAYDFIKSNNDPEVFHTNYEVLLPNGKKLNEGKVIMSGFEAAIMKNNFLSCNNVFVRSDVCKRYPFEENRKMAVAEDWALWLTLSARYKLHMLPDITSAIIMHDQRSIKDWQAEKIEEREALLAKYVLADKEIIRRYRRFLPRFLSDRHSFTALIYAVQGKKQRARYFLKQAFRRNWKVIFTKRFLAVSRKVV